MNTSAAVRNKEDISGHLHAFINQANESCSRAFKAGRLKEFESDWLDSVDGKVATLEAGAWFAVLKPGMKQALTEVARRYLRSEVNYLREIETILSAGL